LALGARVAAFANASRWRPISADIVPRAAPA